MGMDQRVVRRERFELVGRRDESQAGDLAELGRDGGRELRVGVEPRSHRRLPSASSRKCGSASRRWRIAVIELGDISRELLTEREWRCVLKVGAPDLDDLGEGLGLLGQHVTQPGHARQQAIVDRLHGRDVHRGGKDVVGGLSAVDVVVRMDLAALAAHAAEELAGAVRQHLVHVHVRLGAAAGLPDGQRELTRMQAIDDLVGGLGDGLGLVLGENPKGQIHRGAGALDLRQGAQQLGRHLLARDLEEVQRALGLRSPEVLVGNLDRSEGVFFDAGFAHGGASTARSALRQRRRGFNACPPSDRRLRARLRRPGAQDGARHQAGHEIRADVDERHHRRNAGKGVDAEPGSAPASRARGRPRRSRPWPPNRLRPAAPPRP